MPARTPAAQWVIGLLLMVAACTGETGAGSSDITAQQSPLLIVEVLATPARSQWSFVELRNDSEATIDLRGFILTVGDKRRRLQALDVGAGKSMVVAPHGLALLVDKETPIEEVRQKACEAPIATTREALGESHAANDDVLSSILKLQQSSNCVPVMAIRLLNRQLSHVGQLAISHRDIIFDRAEIDLDSAPVGVSWERRDIGYEAFSFSPLGATPATRGYFRSDREHFRNTLADPPLAAYSASPWRVGDTILALLRQATDSSSQQQINQLLSQARAVASGELPPNPLASSLGALTDQAHENIRASFYQMNDITLVDDLVRTKGRTVDIKLGRHIGSSHGSRALESPRRSRRHHRRQQP